jgi:hypothetical protein
MSDDITSKKLEATGKIDDYLKTEFENRTYGEGIKCCILVLNCLKPNKFSPYDFETGCIISKKYTKSQKYLEFDFKLNYKELSNTQTEEEIIELIKKGITISFLEISKMDIPKFNFDNFYTDLKEIFNKRGWENNDYPFKNIPFPEYLFKTSKKIPLMKESIFWELLESSRKLSRDSYEQCEVMISLLEVHSAKNIIGFEHLLRILLQKLVVY